VDTQGDGKGTALEALLPMTLYKIVSFYTPDYESYAKGLIESIQTHLLGVPYEIDPIPQRRWAEATCFKAEFILEKLRVSKDRVLWIDADALVAGELSFPPVDFAIYARWTSRLRYSWSPFRTGTVLLAPSAEGITLAEEWVKRSKRKDGIDQWGLWNAWHALMNEGGIMPTTHFLHLSYCQKKEEAGEPKIVHLMASRRLKKLKP